MARFSQAIIKGYCWGFRKLNTDNSTRKYKDNFYSLLQHYLLFCFFPVGSESGKASQSIATRVPGKGTEDIQARSGGIGDVMAKNMEV